MFGFLQDFSVNIEFGKNPERNSMTEKKIIKSGSVGGKTHEIKPQTRDRLKLEQQKNQYSLISHQKKEKRVKSYTQQTL